MFPLLACGRFGFTPPPHGEDPAGESDPAGEADLIGPGDGPGGDQSHPAGGDTGGDPSGDAGPQLDPRIDLTACATAVLEDHAYACQPALLDVPASATLTWSPGPLHDCSWLSVDPDSGLLSGTPNDDQVGACVVDLRAADSVELALLAGYVLRVDNVPPTLVIADAPVVLRNLGPLILRADADVQASDEGFGAYALGAVSTGLACTDFGDATIDVLTGAIGFDPQGTTAVPCAVLVTFDDGNGGVVEARFHVPAIIDNTPPTISQACALSVNQDDSYACQLVVHDPDAGDLHTWSVDTSLGGRCPWTSIDPATGLITGTPRDDNVGSCRLSYKVDDGYSSSASSDVTITVVNLLPQLLIIDPGPLVVYSYDDGFTALLADAEVQANEEGYGYFAFRRTTAPACADLGDVLINERTGALAFDADRSAEGTCHIDVVFDDRNGGIANHELAVAVVRNPPAGMTVSVGTPNLLINGGCEDGFVVGDLVGWTELVGTGWRCNQEVWPREGAYLMFAGGGALAELEQLVDLSALAATIDAGAQQFLFRGYVHSWGVSDTSRIVLEYLDASQSAVLDHWDSGEHAPADWLRLEDLRAAPPGSRFVRVHLISTRYAGNDNDGYYDYLVLQGWESIQ